MKVFADLPLSRKLLTMVLGTTAIVLLASWSILVAFDLFSMRRELTRELGTLTDVIAANGSATLASGSLDEADELLGTLKTDRSVVWGALYRDDGSLFAAHDSRVVPPARLQEPASDLQRFHDGQFMVVRRVVQGNRSLGTLVIVFDLKWWYQRMWVYVGVSLGVVSLAFIAATLFSKFLRRSITRPVDELARVARDVSERGNFAVRVRRFGNDELGALSDAFNHMLSQLQQRAGALRESEEQRKIALEASGLGTWRYDFEHRRLTRDGSLNHLLGLDPVPTQVSPDDLPLRVHPDDREPVERALRQAYDQRSDVEVEYRVMRPDGTVRWVRDRGRCIDDHDGHGAYLAGAVLDITERRESEEEIRRLNADLERRVAQRTAELEDSNKNLEAFAYSVSHDLRAPLRIISGYAEVLIEDRGDELPSDHKLCLGRIVDGARKMNRLIDDLLQFSRLGQQTLKMQRTSLDRLVDDVLLDFDREMANRTVEWRRLPLPSVNCDPGLLRQVYSNLLSNALKYSRPRNPAIIELGCQAGVEQDVFYVRDNGVGFDSGGSHRLFGVFQRLHSAQEFEGDGVGLATAARIIRRHGGRIWAESQPDHGATFFFSLPPSQGGTPDPGVQNAAH